MTFLIIAASIVLWAGCARANDTVPNRLIPSTGEQLQVPAIRTDRPRLMFTPDSLERMQEGIRRKEEPWFETSRTILREAEKLLTAGRPPEPNTGRHSFEFYDAAVREGEEARLFAYAWLISGEDRFARKAINYLATWSTATPTPASDFDPEIRFPGTGMEVARAAIPFLESYDLLADHPALSADNKQAIESWFRVLVGPIMEGKRRWQENNYFNRQDFQNHLTAHTMGVAAIGYVLGDEKLVQYALDHPENEKDFKALISGTILMPGDSPHHREPAFALPPQKGEIYDRYRHFTGPHRGLQYAHLSLSQLLYTAELAWNNGIDFYRFEGTGGENIRYPLEFYADFYRLKDASLKGGFYVQDARGRFPGEADYDDSMNESGRIRTWEVAIFEVGNSRYPDTPKIRALLESVDRSAVPRHPHSYFFLPVLTHGEGLE